MSVFAVAVLATRGAAAVGNQAVDIDHLQLAATASDFLATEGAGKVKPWAFRFVVAYRYLNRPLVLLADGERTAMVTTRSVVEMGGSVQLGRWVGLGVVLPMLVESSGAAMSGGGFALGDLRLVPRVELVHTSVVGLALLAGVRAPTGATDKFLGEGMAVFEPRLALQSDLAHGIVHIGLNLGARIRQHRKLYDVDVGHEAIASLALAVAPRPYIEGIAEVQAATALSSSFAAKQVSPVEIVLGVRGGYAGFRAGLAVGLGAVDGFGAPRVRALATLEYRRERPEKLAVVAPTPTPPRPPAEPELEPFAAPDIVLPGEEETTIEEQRPEEPAVVFKSGRIELGDPIFFKTDRKRIRHQYYDELQQLASALQHRPTVTTVWIEGHADATGPEAWNLTLSRRRAEEVARYLAAHGVAEVRLRPVGFGEARPLVPLPRGTESERNRRVQFFTDVASEAPSPSAAPVAATAAPVAGVDSERNDPNAP